MKQLLVVLVLAGVCRGQSRLGTYNVDPAALSVSGLSSGAAFATQFQVAHSEEVMGVGLLAGAPYYCAKGNLMTAVDACMKYPQSINLSNLHLYTQQSVKSGTVDPVCNMASARVFIFSGTKDTVVVPGVVKKLEEYYRAYVAAPGAIATVYDIPAHHGFPTDRYGGACGSPNSDYINNCNYNAAYELLEHIYGGLQKPPTSHVAQGQLTLFDQAEFFKLAPAPTYGMDTAGYVYVPPPCHIGARCRLHIAFHGCLQQRGILADRYAKTTGYNEVADLNNLIILYPQAKKTLTNPNGCWDCYEEWLPGDRGPQNDSPCAGDLLRLR
ncbi:poly(3-hydroxybutyrate) depolymerase-like isoform X2 [Ambystoma mexicanum]|uniref:poly(3-hydroxybutyrate) depolymerase-like isoform X2 n=1 Tax=Ambystoma mexicanum TaxID=8296 RepID=UPI0037E92DF3